MRKQLGTDEGLKRASSVHCDELVSIRKSVLTDFVGGLSFAKIAELDRSLRIAIGA